MLKIMKDGVLVNTKYTATDQRKNLTDGTIAVWTRTFLAFGKKCLKT